MRFFKITETVTAHRTVNSIDEHILHSRLPSFQDTLFPYVRENLKKYIETKWEDEEFKQDFEKLKEQVNIGNN